MNNSPFTVAGTGLLLILGLSLSGCALIGSDDGPVRDLQDAERRWTEQNLENYRFLYQKLCFCGFIGKVQITVRDGEVVDGFVLETGDPLPFNELSYVPTIEELFTIIADAQQRDAHQLEVSYSGQGYPERIIIDYRQNVADDEFSYYVEAVEALD